LHRATARLDWKNRFRDQRCFRRSCPRFSDENSRESHYVRTARLEVPPPVHRSGGLAQANDGGACDNITLLIVRSDAPDSDAGNPGGDAR